MAAASAAGGLSLTGSLPVRVAGDAALTAVLAAYLLSPTLIANRRGASSTLLRVSHS